ncbi:hypothetical protein ACQYWY_21620 [Comamonas sediminis]|jgi:hypothetical protein|uniref:hypothetical protein n=1 Tax=Comamonas sediminis TaxID=1783360 RepID=UPI003D2AC2BC
MKTLHLMTQRNQPYGSERRCCEQCGLMLVWRDKSFWDDHTYTDEAQHYHDDHAGLTTCDTQRAQQREGQ